MLQVTEYSVKVDIDLNMIVVDESIENIDVVAEGLAVALMVAKRNSHKCTITRFSSSDFAVETISCKEWYGT